LTTRWFFTKFEEFAFEKRVAGALKALGISKLSETFLMYKTRSSKNWRYSKDTGYLTRITIRSKKNREFIIDQIPALFLITLAPASAFKATEALTVILVRRRVK